MTGNILENNMVSISGKILSVPKFSHEVYGEGFYLADIQVLRLSDMYDVIPVLLSERLVPLEELVEGRFVSVEGQFRSYNNYNDDGNKLLLTVFAREIVFIDEVDSIKNPNQIYLNGFICKRPIYRTTPFGREITDILLAVNRHYNKSDYLPCISWGRNARFASSFQVGDNVKVWGRIQSRTYQKKLQSGEAKEKVAYEVSITKMELVKSNNNKNEQDA